MKHLSSERVERKNKIINNCAYEEHTHAYSAQSTPHLRLGRIVDDDDEK